MGHTSKTLLTAQHPLPSNKGHQTSCVAEGRWVCCSQGCICSLSNPDPQLGSPLAGRNDTLALSLSLHLEPELQ